MTKDITITTSLPTSLKSLEKKSNKVQMRLPKIAMKVLKGTILKSSQSTRMTKMTC